MVVGDSAQERERDRVADCYIQKMNDVCWHCFAALSDEVNMLYKVCGVTLITETMFGSGNGH